MASDKGFEHGTILPTLKTPAIDFAFLPAFPVRSPFFDNL